jgi:hypothetical protein
LSHRMASRPHRTRCRQKPSLRTPERAREMPKFAGQPRPVRAGCASVTSGAAAFRMATHSFAASRSSPRKRSD